MIIIGERERVCAWGGENGVLRERIDIVDFDVSVDVYSFACARRERGEVVCYIVEIGNAEMPRMHARYGQCKKVENS